MWKLAAIVTASFALSATPALAAEIPYGDDDPSHWRMMGHDTMCAIQYPCTFSATTTDMVTTATEPGQSPQHYYCDSMTTEYTAASVDHWEVTDVQTQGDCMLNFERDLRPCIYSPSGFSNGTQDIEVWIREGTTPTYPWAEQTGIFGKASGSTVGTDQYEIDSWTYDQQEGSADPQTVSVVIDGTTEVDDGPLVLDHYIVEEHECGFQELVS